ncbi:hypothetical protein [Roseovarius sp. 2305UL8-3]|uniref:hypothetical protein n=1 Tax=Roseovarius conchicola TaxID=3121636 RepID=UPI00352870DA
MIRLAVLSLCSCLLALPAAATPPRVTSSDDRMMAATQTHLYVLRDVVDNLGSHYSALHDQHLVEISLDTGEATRFWPLRRMGLNGLPVDEFLNPSLVTNLGGDVYDMMAILGTVGAQPISPGPWSVDDLSVVDGALMRGDQKLLTPFAIRAAGRAQLAILREAYPPIETEEEYRREERIDFYDLYQEGEWLCELAAEGQSFFRETDRIVAAKLRCEDQELYGIWSFHVLIHEDND